MMELDPKLDLSFSRTLAAPRSLIWTCWTSAEHIPHFFVPAPHKVLSCDLDLRVGGRFDTIFEVNGQPMENKGVYLEIIPGEKLVFTDGYSEGWKPSAKPFMTAILMLEDAGEGATKYTVVARHAKPETAKHHEDMGFFDGWGTVATQVEEYAQSLM